MSAAAQQNPDSRAADAVVAQLEAQIVAGTLPSGHPLPAERELMEDFGASRTVIREAISTLSNRGLIESKPRFRPIVRKPDFGTVLHATGNIVQHLLTEHGGIKNLYDSRVFIERGLVRDAAISATKDDIADLKNRPCCQPCRYPEFTRILRIRRGLSRRAVSHSEEPDFPDDPRRLYCLAWATVEEDGTLS